jgi:hypothetical protein
MKIKSKLIEEYLREVFVPLTQYRQLEIKAEISYYI